jgi:hypothetical protein
MGWVTQRGPRKCRFLDLRRRRFSEIAILICKPAEAIGIAYQRYY